MKKILYVSVLSLFSAVFYSCGTKTEETSSSNEASFAKNEELSQPVNDSFSLVHSNSTNEESVPSGSKSSGIVMDIENTASELIQALQYFPFQDLESAMLKSEDYLKILEGIHEEWKVDQTNATNELLVITSSTESITFKLYKGEQNIVAVLRYLHPTNQPLSFYELHSESTPYTFHFRDDLKLSSVKAGDFLSKSSPEAGNSEDYSSAMDYSLASEGIRVDLNSYTATVHAGWENLNEEDVKYYFLYPWNKNEFSKPVRKARK